MTDNEKEVFLILNGWTKDSETEKHAEWSCLKFSSHYFTLDYAYQVQVSNYTPNDVIKDILDNFNAFSRTSI